MGEILLLRHGATRGNLEHRYIGRTDEPLSPQGRQALMGRQMPPADRLLVSPLLRCRQTAALLYPALTQEIVPGLRECDFGDFENKNWEELDGDPRYQAWIDSGGSLGFPGGESLAEFQQRCLEAFWNSVDHGDPGETLAFVVHGGTIMAILGGCGQPKRAYFDWQVKNGCGYRVQSAPGHQLIVEAALEQSGAQEKE